MSDKLHALRIGFHHLQIVNNSWGICSEDKWQIGPNSFVKLYGAMSFKWNVIPLPIVSHNTFIPVKTFITA